jgi:asparagine synthase (glutamine-hydrolysing)
VSGILGVIGGEADLRRDSDISAMLAALKRRGDQTEVWRHDGAVLAVARFDWELAPGYSGASLIVHDDDITVAADATLYYRDELKRRLRLAGSEPRADTPGHLIAAAYRVWGVDCPRYFDGDFAFVLFDHGRRCTFAARDVLGRRGLHLAKVGDALLLASSVSAVVAHPRCSAEFDRVALAETISVSLSGEERTPYAAIRAVPAANWLLRREDGTISRGRYWEFPPERDESESSFDAAVEELRALLSTAVMERVAPTGPTAIWLSGGYDSPVLYGIGNDAMRAAGRGELDPISVSYPEGDPGREDEEIAGIVAFWKSASTWVSIGDIPLLRAAAEHAAIADVPFQHAFENWLRTLLATTRARQSRVALYGDGGDQLFAVSSIFLHDLFGAFRWGELAREWRVRSSAGVRGLWEHVARPVLGETVRTIRGYDRPDMDFPSWIREDFAQSAGLADEQRRREQALRGGLHPRAWAETKGSLVNPVIQRVAAAMTTLGLEFGVELRAPLLDRRVVEFALSRPRRERASRAAVKHLLRRAADGLLPPNVLLPRPRKTGVLTGYFADSFRGDQDGIVTAAFRDPILGDLGIIDPGRTRQSWIEYRDGRTNDGGRLFVAFQTELWLAARAGKRLPHAGYGGTAQPRALAAGFVQ